MVPQTTSRWMSITLNWNSSVVETNTLVSFTVHCRAHLGHTYHAYTQTLHSAMSRQPSLLPVATTSSLTARYVAHTLERPLAYAVVVDRPLRCTRSYACSHTPSSLTARFVAHTVPLYSCQRIFSTQESPSQQLWLTVRLADPPFAPHFVCIIHTWLNTSAS